MAERLNKRFLLIIKLSEKSAKEGDLKAIGIAGKRIKAALELLPMNDLLLAFSSSDGRTFGFFLQTYYDAPGIIRALESPGKSITSSNALRDDEVLVVQLGKQFDQRNLGVAATWLQLHQEKSAV